MLQVTFREIASVLEGAGSQIVAAEGHGCLCGALCTSPDYSLERWLDEIVAADEAGEDEEAASTQDPDPALRLLFIDTQRALRSDAMEFEPLLPDDDESLEKRATALSQWCQGFLYGFGTGHPLREGDLTVEVDEVLRDLSHIARASPDVGAASEEEEQAYSEVVEYVRVGVQLVHDELATVRDTEAVGGDSVSDRDDPIH